ncbi:AT-hook motif nuclear-localized protein 14-like protein [Cinnamomum micranthum f. kanehirae]|uniref:AT-hook motif nuclear-localized protein n=1 Tax=Cinnamomum micranthum f. kanehirae TaxID=337451 RepID=A0A3S3PUC0_9MAGN|nr:AT-hook motif nuclear-localized protein 14-like protein [Cinnamomum micranthum f. kanehirae]
MAKRRSNSSERRDGRRTRQTIRETRKRCLSVSVPPLSTPVKSESMAGMTSGKRAGSGGANFIDHEINVCAGEDVAYEIISLACEERREIRVISAEGTILDATLIDAGNSLLIPGHFRILSFFGGSKPIKIKGAKNVVKSRYKVSLEAADGGVIRGIVGLPFTALSPVKVVARISAPGTQHEPKTKRTRAAKTK